MYRDAGPGCDEVIGAVECLEPRRSQETRCPYRRLGRVREPSGRWRLVHLTDFGTDRERYAADDTWSEAQVRAYLTLRARLVEPWSRPPPEFGVIVPPREREQLPHGHFVPPEHLEIQPRIFAVEPALDGARLPLLADGPPLSATAARGVLAAMVGAVDALLRWAPREPRPILTPGHLDVELWLLRGGDVELRPRFRYVPSADYAFSTKDLNTASARAPALAGDLAGLLTALELQAAIDPRGSLSGTLAATCRAIDERSAAWPPCLPSAAPPVDPDARSAVGEYVEQHMHSHGGLHAEARARLLTLLPADPGVRRWSTRPLIAPG